MAAFDTLWLDSMSPSPQYTPDNGRSSLSQDANPTTVAVFSPQSLSHSPSSRQRSKIIVQQQSPLLASTPPQITRALAYSHPFLLPLNRAVGLVTWTTDDPWESFLLLTTFGATVLYGDILLRWAGPCMIAMILIVGIYSRRFSLLSPTARRNRDFAKGKDKETVRKAHPEQQKGFDEIVDTLQLFTRRCNILIDPLIDLLDYLSAQQSEGSPTNKTALNRLLLRLLLLTPIWAIFAYPRVGLITTRRAVLTVGTLILSWHSRSARVSRAILWRSATVRRLCSRLTGLDLESASISGPPTASIQSAVQPLAASVTSKPSISPSPSPKTESTGVRFTFTLWENQRRWLGLGWTNSLFAYERAAWTDEHLNAVPSKEALELPEVESGDSRWQWVEGSEWHVEGEGGSQGSTKNDKKRGKSRDAGSWIYYDSKWQDGRRGQDGWNRYTRRRKWYRDAELVEVTPDEGKTSSPVSKPSTEASVSGFPDQTAENPADHTEAVTDTASTASSPPKRRWFRKAGHRSSDSESTFNSQHDVRTDDDEDHPALPHHQVAEEGGWGVGDDAKMSLG